MAYTYTYIDSERVESAVARAYAALEAEFQRVWGLDLLISSGTRTREEQAYLYHLYITGQGNLAAPPGSSNHEEYGPRGPRALDVRDSGGDPGVTRAGTPRSNWLRHNAPRFGFDPAGFRFSQVEPWHIEYTGSLGGGVSGTNPDGTLVVDGVFGPATITKLQAVVGAHQDGILGPDTISKWQTRVGATVDGELGPETISKTQERIGATVDGELGPETVSKLQAHLNAGGTLQAPINPDAPLTVDGILGVATISKWQKSVGAAVDGILGQETISKTQAAVGVPVDGQMGPVTVKGIQFNVGAVQDGVLGSDTISKLQAFLNAGTAWKKVPAPVEPEIPSDGTEADYTPNLVTPTAADFPAWIRYEEVIDPEALNPTLNKGAFKYYGRKYSPIEHHAHWWGAPNAGYTFDGTVNHCKNSADLSVNYVTEPGRITLMVPLNKIALTTGARNPWGWKSENNPVMTTDAGRELGYKTLGYLLYIVEEKNPHLRDEPIRLDKEFRNTECSLIQVGLVREYAEKFRTGALDPATGQPPVVTGPGDPATVVAEVKQAYATLGTAINKLED